MSRTADAFLAEHPEILHEDRTRPGFVRFLAWAVTPLALWHRFRIRGLERVPAGGCLIVANHSIGAVFEIALLLRAWQRRLGRPARGLAHRLAWAPFFHPFVQWAGAVFAHPKVAAAVLARGHALLVFPGGELDAMRPFSARYEVRLAGRRGFARLAREAGVPIVPLVLCGSHATYVTLPTPVRGPFGLKIMPFSYGLAFAASLGVATLAHPPLWPWLVAALVHAVIPWPARIEAEALAPMHAEPGETDAELAGRVGDEMQRAMDRLAAQRATPLG